MAESKGCAKAFRRVMRGALQSTCSPGCELSNMRDWVATLESYSTRARRFNTEDIEKRRKKKASATRKKYGTANYDCPTKKSIICSEEDRPKSCPTFWRPPWRRRRRISW